MLYGTAFLRYIELFLSFSFDLSKSVHARNQHLEDAGRRIWNRPAWVTYGELVLTIIIIIHNNNKYKACSKFN